MKSLPLAVASAGIALVLLFMAPIDAHAAVPRNHAAAIPARGHAIASTPRPQSTATRTPPRRQLMLPNLTEGAIAAAAGGALSNCDGIAELPATPPPQTRVSTATPFTANCDGAVPNGALFTNSEVEPFVAINPLNANNLVGAWQQDRWSSGGARGIVAGVSQDGGATWSVQKMAFTRCGGGTAGNGGNYARATDPWVSFSPDGTAHQIALAFNGFSFQAGSVNSMVVSRSLNGGTAWSNPIALITDGPQFFNDKNTITADPTDSNYVYAAWDRLGATGGGPAYFARTTNGGVTWEPAHAIYDPGPSSQTIGSVIAGRADGLLLDVFTQLDEAPDHTTTGFLAVMRSTDKGANWSAPIFIADLLSIGAHDPDNGTAIRDGSIIPQMAIAPDGTIYVVWQDARFSGGLRDGIALSRSTDGGLTWSAPVRVNRKGSVQAFTANVQVRADGVVAVTYYDLSSNTPDTATLPTDYWIAQSADGLVWRWDRVSPAFNLATAPNAEGLFLGDYQGLVGKGAQFVPFFVRTNADLANRTDVFSAPTKVVAFTAPSAADLAESLRIASEKPPPPNALLRKRVHENIVRQAEGLPGWRHGVRRPTVPRQRMVDPERVGWR